MNCSHLIDMHSKKRGHKQNRLGTTAILYVLFLQLVYQKSVRIEVK